MIRSFEIFAELAKLVSYKPGWFILCKQDDKGMFLQVEVTAIAEASIDTVTGQRTGWKGAKHYFSGHMCDSEFVGTIFKAFLQAEEHESREHFRFKGRSVYNPHFNIHALVELAKHKENFDMRENAMSMVEEPPKPLTEEEIIQNIIDNSHGCRELE